MKRKNEGQEQIIDTSRMKNGDNLSDFAIIEKLAIDRWKKKVGVDCDLIYNAKFTDDFRSYVHCCANPIYDAYVEAYGMEIFVEVKILRNGSRLSLDLLSKMLKAVCLYRKLKQTSACFYVLIVGDSTNTNNTIGKIESHFNFAKDNGLLKVMPIDIREEDIDTYRKKSHER